MAHEQERGAHLQNNAKLNAMNEKEILLFFHFYHYDIRALSPIVSRLLLSLHLFHSNFVRSHIISCNLSAFVFPSSVALAVSLIVSRCNYSSRNGKPIYRTYQQEVSPSARQPLHTARLITAFN